jgi:uncharacterized phage protein (TIGR01671 family)
MREGIGKYRGKRVDNGEWVYGCLMRTSDKTKDADTEEVFSDCWIIPVDNLDICFCYGGSKHSLHARAWIVDPATVGQFTGLKDMKGKDIYEGDICKAEAYDPKVMHEIVFADCAFCAKVPNIPFCNDMTLYMCSKYEHSSLTILGNVHDNPELIK